jgi:membrane protease YdiL (CAAX protease family)
MKSGPATEKKTLVPSFLRGQLFLFDRWPEVGYSSQQGLKLLSILIFLEGVVRPASTWAAKHYGFGHAPWWTLIQIPSLLGIALLLVTRVAQVPLSELGMRRWRIWSRTEKNFFPQIVAITLGVFFFAASSQIHMALKTRSLGEIVCFAFVPSVIWGFYQEFLYRAVLQTELIRRFGTRIGILVGNLLFTFGPLHTYHFALSRGDPGHLAIFAGIFAIGLYFAVLYRFSGNLWIVGILHGLGDFFIDGLSALSRLSY